MDSTVRNIEEMTISGCVRVNGHAHCCVDSVLLSETGLLSITSDDENENVVFKDLTSVTFNGKLQLNTKGDCIFDCKQSILMNKNCQISLAVNRCILSASQTIEMKNHCRIEVERGKLYLTNAKDGEQEIHGLVLLSGEIIGKFQQDNTESCTDAMVDNLARSELEVEGKNVHVCGLVLGNFHSVDLFAAMDFSVDQNSCLQIGANLEIQATNIELQGKISQIQKTKILAQSSLKVRGESKISHGTFLEIMTETVEIKGDIQQFNNIDFDVANLLNLGRINMICELRVETEAIMVNSGEMHGKNIGIVAPIYLSCPANFDSTCIDTIPTMEIEGQLLIEGLLRIVVGSHITAKEIDIKSVLNFEFSSKLSNIPEQGDLDRWKSIVDSSLSKLSSASSGDDVSRLVKKAMEIPKVVCNFGVSSGLCKDIVQISKTICDGGLDSFKMSDLMDSLDKAHTLYSQITPLRVSNSLRIRLIKIKDCGKQIARNLINKVFGSKCFSKTLEFHVSAVEGIKYTTLISEGRETETITQGQFIAMSLDVNGIKGIWRNEGHLEACGDIIISASRIEFKGGKGRLLKAVAGCIQLNGDLVDVQNLESKQLKVNAENEADIRSANVTEEASVAGSNVNMNCIKMGDLKVEANGKATVKNADILRNTDISAEEIYVCDNKSKNLSCNAHKEIFIGTATVQDNIELQSGDKVEVGNMISGDIIVKSQGNANIKSIKAGHLEVMSKEGNISLDEKVEANTGSFQAKHGQISLTDKYGKANHKFGSVQFEAKEINEVENLLSNTGLYKDMEIADHLGLIVEDQDVILANKQKSQFNISLKAKSIDIRQDMDAKNIELETTKGELKIRKNVSIKSRENISLRSKQELNISEGSSLTAGRNVHLESKDSSINLLASKIAAGTNVSAHAAGDINISSTGSGEHTKRTTITAGNRGSDKPSIDMKSGNDIKIHNSDVISSGKNRFIAKNDITITAHTHETTSRKTKYSWWGLKSETTVTTTTHVQKPKICGETNVFIAGGHFKSIAAEFKSETGNKIHAKGKVSMLDIKGKTRTCTTSEVLGGLLSYNKKENYVERSHGTLVEDSCAAAHTTVTSETSDIEWLGSSVKTPGSFSESAKKGTITHSRRILENNYNEFGFGFFMSKSNSGDENNSGSKVGFEIYNKTEDKQTTSDDSVEVGGNYTVQAKKFSVLNACDVNVGGDMSLDAEEIRVEGATLSSGDSDFHFGLSLEQTTIKGSLSYSSGSKTQHQTQSLQVAGKLKIDNAKNVTFKNTSVDVGAIAGQVENMEVISEADTESKTGFGIEVGVDVVTRAPSGSLSISHGSSKKVNEVTCLNIHGDSKDLSVGKLELTGAAIVFDGDVHNFASKIVNNEVHEFSNQFGFGFSASKPTSLKGQKKIELKIDVSWGRFGSCITSKEGSVDSHVAQQINTDLEKCRKDDGSFKFAVSHEFKGKLSKQIVAIGKELAKTAGKEALLEYGKQIASELGLPEDIVQNVINFAQGDITKDKIFNFVGTNLGNLCLPKDFLEAFKALVNDGNPEKLLLWIGEKANMNLSMIMPFIGICQGKIKPKEMIESIIQCAAKYLGLTDQLVKSIAPCLKMGDGSKSKKKSAISSVVSFLQTPEGQTMFLEITKILNVSESVVEFVIAFLKQTKHAERAILLIELAGKTLNCPEEILAVTRDLVLDHNPLKLVLLVCKQCGINSQMTEIVQKTFSLFMENDIKCAVSFLIKSLGEVCGLSAEIVNKTEEFINGTITFEHIAKLFLKMFVQLGTIYGGEGARNIVGELEKILPAVISCFEHKGNTILYCKKMVDGEIHLEMIRVIIFFLRNYDTGIPIDVLCGVESLILHRDPGKVVSWISEVTHIDHSILLMLGQGLLQKRNIIEMLVTFYLERCGLSVYSEDILLIIYGKKPQNILKNLYEHVQLDKEQEIIGKCHELCVPPKVSSLLQILITDETSTKLFRCFSLIIQDIGIPADLVNALTELLTAKKSDLLAQYIEQKTGIDRCFITIVLEFIASQQINQQTVLNIVNKICKMMKLSAEQTDQLKAALDGHLTTNEIGILLVQLFWRMLCQFSIKNADKFNIPVDLLERCCDIEITNNTFEWSLQLAELLACQFGMPIDLVHAARCLVSDGNGEPLSSWISNKSGIDKSLLLSIFKTLQEQNQLSNGFVRIPVCIARHYNISKETITILEGLLCGTVPDFELSEQIFMILKDVGRICLDSEKNEVLCSVIGANDWLERIIHLVNYFVPKLGVPAYMIDAVKLVIQIRNTSQNKQKAVILMDFVGKNLSVPREILIAMKDILVKCDPYKLVRVVCKYLGLDEHFTGSVIKIYKSTASRGIQCAVTALVKEIGTHCGLSTDVLDGLSKLLKGQQPKHGIPVFFLHVFIQLARSKGNESVRKVAEDLENLMPLATDFITQITNIRSRGKQILSGQSKTIGMQFIVFLLRFLGIPEDILVGINRFVLEQNTDILFSWLSSATNINKETLLQFVDTIVQGGSIKQIIKVLFSYYSEKCSLPRDLSEDICLMIDGQNPVTVIKTLKEVVTGTKEKTSKEDILKLCGNIDIPANLINFVINLLDVSDSEDKFVGYFTVIAQECGLQDDLIKGFKELALNKNGNTLANWVEKKTGITSPLVCFVLEYMVSQRFDQQVIEKLLRAVCLKLGLSQADIQRMEKALRGSLSTEEVTNLLLQLFSKTVEPHIIKLAKIWNIPTDWVEHVLSTNNVKDLSYSIVYLIADKTGIPSGLVPALKSAVIDNNCESLSHWISVKTGVDKTLLTSIITMLQNEKVLLNGLINIPVYVARHYNLSEETVSILQDLLHGKFPTVDTTKIFLTIVKDVCKVCLDIDNFELLIPCFGEGSWQDKAFCLLRFLAIKFDIPVQWVDGLKEFVEKRDLTKLAEVLSDKLGIDKNILLILVGAIQNGDSPKQLLKHLGENFGIPGTAMDLIEEVIKNKTKVGQNRIYKVYTSRINWEKVCKPVKVAA